MTPIEKENEQLRRVVLMLANVVSKSSDTFWEHDNGSCYSEGRLCDQALAMLEDVFPDIYQQVE